MEGVVGEKQAVDGEVVNAGQVGEGGALGGRRQRRRRGSFPHREEEEEVFFSSRGRLCGSPLDTVA